MEKNRMPRSSRFTRRTWTEGGTHMHAQTHVHTHKYTLCVRTWRKQHHIKKHFKNKGWTDWQEDVLSWCSFIFTLLAKISLSALLHCVTNTFAQPTVKHLYSWFAAHSQVTLPSSPVRTSPRALEPNTPRSRARAARTSQWELRVTIKKFQCQMKCSPNGLIMKLWACVLTLLMKKTHAGPHDSILTRTHTPGMHLYQAAVETIISNCANTFPTQTWNHISAGVNSYHCSASFHSNTSC